MGTVFKNTYLFVKKGYGSLYRGEPELLNICSKVEPLRVKYNRLIHEQEQVEQVNVMVLDDEFGNPDYHPGCLQGKILFQNNEYIILITRLAVEREEILECLIAHEFGHLVCGHKIKGIDDEMAFRNTKDEIAADQFALKYTSKSSMEKFLHMLLDEGPRIQNTDPVKKMYVIEMSARMAALEGIEMNLGDIR